MKLKLYTVGNRYAFSVDKFSSLSHFFLINGIKDTYKYAWQAYKDAIKIAKTKTSHLEAIRIKKYAVEDLTRPVIMDVSAEEMLLDHFKTLLVILGKKAKGSKDDPDKQDIVYQEIKAVVEGLLKAKEEIEEEKEKTQIDDIISKFRVIVKEHFSKQLSKDIAKKNEESQASQDLPPDPQTAPVDGQEPQLPPQAPPVPQASSIHNIKTASSVSSVSKEIKEEMMQEYGERICTAIEKKHPSAIFKVSGSNIDVVDSSNGNKMLKIQVNSSLNVDKIIPMGDLADIYPLYSSEFYQRYWKPIVEKIGHFYLDDASVVLASKMVSLPDIPSKCPKTYQIKGWNTKQNREAFVSLSFSGKDALWKFDSIQQPQKIKVAKVAKNDKKLYTEEDFVQDAPKRVMCIDPVLKSLYGKIGEVVQVIPLEQTLEVDIDFGRSVVRLSGDQIEIQNN